MTWLRSCISSAEPYGIPLLSFILYPLSNTTTSHFHLSTPHPPKKNSMKTFATISAFLLLALQVAFAQPASLTGMRVVDAIHADDGYYVLSESVRETEEDNMIQDHTTPQLIHIDASLRPLWALDFAEERIRTMQFLTRVGDRLYVAGTQYPGGGDQGVGWLVCTDLSGNALWEHTARLDGYHTIEGTRLYAAPDGDLIWTSIAYRRYNSYGHPLVMRLDPQGRERWRQTYSTGSTMAIVSSCAVLADGNLAFAGADFKVASEYVDNSYKGAIWKVDAATGKVIWQRVIAPKLDTQWRSLLPTSDGGMRIAGYFANKHEVAQPLAMDLDAAGNVLRTIPLPQPEGCRLSHLEADPQGGYWGWGRAAEHLESGQPHMVLKFDEHMQPVGSQAFGPFPVSTVLQRPEGGWLAFGWEGGIRTLAPMANAAYRQGGMPAAAPLQGVGRPRKVGAY